MPKNFKEFIKDEGLDNNKNKAFIRTGWDGRQEEIDYLKQINEKLGNLSLENFEKWEAEKVNVAKLEELIAQNEDLVARSYKIINQNQELLTENKKINKALTKISKDLVEYNLNLEKKDKLIEMLNEKLIKKK